MIPDTRVRRPPGMPRIHVRRHGCMTCGKAFVRPSELERHLRTHTGEKPYHCRFCSWSFAVPGALKSHTLRLHRVELMALCGSTNSADIVALAARSAEMSSGISDNHTGGTKDKETEKEMGKTTEAGLEQERQTGQSLKTDNTQGQSDQDHTSNCNPAESEKYGQKESDSTGKGAPRDGVHSCFLCLTQFRSETAWKEHMAAHMEENQPD